MARLASAYVDIEPNLKPLVAGLAKAKTDLERFVSHAKVIGRFPLGEGFSLRTIGLAAGTGGIGAALFEAAKKSSALGESLSKARVTFGNDAGSILANTDRLASQFGVVRREAIDAASAFGLMGRAAGLSTTEQAKMANELTNLGIDLASFHNLSRQEAFTKLRAGLAGEAEPLRPLGIMLSEDAVKAEALAIGLTNVQRELTDQEKILARISIIRRAAGPAIGDAERTAESTENIMRKAMGDLENLVTELGSSLEPALVSAIRLAEELGKSLQKSFTGQQGIFEIAASDANRAIGELRDMNAILNSNLSTWQTMKGIGAILFPSAGAAAPGALADKMRGLGVKTGPTAAQIREGQISGTMADIAAATLRSMPPSLRSLAEAELGPEKTAADKRSEARDRTIRDHMRRIQAEQDRALTERLGGVPRGPQGTDAIQRDMANRLMERFGGPGLLNTIRNLTGGPINALMGGGIGGVALATGLQAAQAGLERAGPGAFGEKPARGPSTMFADPADYAREAITGVLSEDPVKKETLEVQKQAAKDLEQIKEDVREGIRNLGHGLRGLFPRG